ncbi:MAG: response regulator [Verrucomicrobiota bacterium]
MKKKIILCVDDEKMVLDTLRTQLTNHYGHAYQCEIAECAEDALELLGEFQQDELSVIIVVSDWLMPGIRGDEFLVRVHNQFPGIVKVMLTGQATAEAIERTTRDADLHRCLHKPWRESDLIETIDSGLSKL